MGGSSAAKRENRRTALPPAHRTGHTGACAMEAFLQPTGVEPNRLVVPQNRERSVPREPIFAADPPRRSHDYGVDARAPIRDPAPLPPTSAAVEHDLRWTLSEHDREKVRDWFERWRHCTRCRRVYREADNLGQWQCRQHMRTTFGPSDTDPRTGRPMEDAHGRPLWRCCGRPELDVYDPRASSNGCVPADHTEHQHAYTAAHDMDVPLRLLEHVRVGAAAIVDREQLDEFTDEDAVPCARVRRFDYHTWDALEQRRERREHAAACGGVGGVGWQDPYAQGRLLPRYAT